MGENFKAVAFSLMKLSNRVLGCCLFNDNSFTSSAFQTMSSIATSPLWSVKFSAIFHVRWRPLAAPLSDLRSTNACPFLGGGGSGARADTLSGFSAVRARALVHSEPVRRR